MQPTGSVPNKVLVLVPMPVAVSLTMHSPYSLYLNEQAVCWITSVDFGIILPVVVLAMIPAVVLVVVLLPEMVSCGWTVVRFG